MKRSSGFPILRIAGGALLVLAGIFAYYGVGFGASAILFLVVGGVIALAAALMGHRARPSDIAIFIIGVLVLGIVSAGYPAGPQFATYSATRGQVGTSAIAVDVSTDTGSISVGFTDRADVAYQVNFTRQAWLSTFVGMGTGTVTNSTSNGVFNLKVESTWSAVSVLLGRGYTVDVLATAGTGSIDLESPAGVALRNISLQSSTGSVTAVIESSSVQSLNLRADTGSVSLVTHGLGAAGKGVPVTLETSTGSISVDASVLSQDAVSITASTSLGSINPNLRGFVISQNTRTALTASAGNLQGATYSFEITATASLGSVNLNIGFA